MAFRVVFIENEASLKYKLDNIIVSINGIDTWIPLEDISMIVLDNLKSTLSTRLMAILAKESISLIICDQQHLPIGFYSCYDLHSRSSKIIGKQIQMEKSLTDIFLKEIMAAKLNNQASVLELLEMPKESIEKVKNFAKEIQPGDPSNREAHGAKVYFNQLMGKSFSRGDDSILLNSGLNYGYTIVRSYLSRLCVGYGLNTQIGVQHCNEYNRFNLVDDLIEPIRPIIDIFAYRLLEDAEYFTGKHRESLVNFLNHKIIYNGKKQYISNALEEYIMSIAKKYVLGDLTGVEFPHVNNYLGEEDEV